MRTQNAIVLDVVQWKWSLMLRRDLGPNHLWKRVCALPWAWMLTWPNVILKIMREAWLIGSLPSNHKAQGLILGFAKIGTFLSLVLLFCMHVSIGLSRLDLGVNSWVFATRVAWCLYPKTPWWLLTVSCFLSKLSQLSSVQGQLISKNFCRVLTSDGLVSHPEKVRLSFALKTIPKLTIRTNDLNGHQTCKRLCYK